MTEQATDKGGSMTKQATGKLTLVVFEEALEEEVQRWENSAIRMGQWLKAGKDARIHEEAGFRSFAEYYRDRWEDRIGRSWSTVKHYIYGARVVEEMRAGRDHEHAVTDSKAAEMLGVIKDPDARNRVWNEFVESGEKRVGYENLDRRISEQTGRGVIEQAEAQGVVVPDEPRGKTPSEAAWLKMAEASRAIRGVEPSDVARVESAKVAARYVEQMAELAEWMHLFVHELNLYAEQSASARR